MSKKSKWRDLIDGKPVEVSFDMAELTGRRTTTPHVNCRCAHEPINMDLYRRVILGDGLLPQPNQKYKLNKKVLIL